MKIEREIVKRLIPCCNEMKLLFEKGAFKLINNSGQLSIGTPFHTIMPIRYCPFCGTKIFQEDNSEIKYAKKVIHDWGCIRLID